MTEKEILEGAGITIDETPPAPSDTPPSNENILYCVVIHSHGKWRNSKLWLPSLKKSFEIASDGISDDKAEVYIIEKQMATIDSSFSLTGNKKRLVPLSTRVLPPSVALSLLQSSTILKDE
jgi:hypothetical protein